MQQTQTNTLFETKNTEQDKALADFVSGQTQKFVTFRDLQLKQNSVLDQSITTNKQAISDLASSQNTKNTSQDKLLAEFLAEIGNLKKSDEA